MKITFQGKSDEYEIEKSYFYNRAFIVKDKIPNRDKIDFITDSVRLWNLVIIALNLMKF